MKVIHKDWFVGYNKHKKDAVQSFIWFIYSYSLRKYQKMPNHMTEMDLFEVRDTGCRGQELIFSLTHTHVLQGGVENWSTSWNLTKWPTSDILREQLPGWPENFSVPPYIYFINTQKHIPMENISCTFMCTSQILILWTFLLIFLK